MPVTCSPAHIRMCVRQHTCMGHQGVAAEHPTPAGSVTIWVCGVVVIAIGAPRCTESNAETNNTRFGQQSAAPMPFLTPYGLRPCCTLPNAPGGGRAWGPRETRG